MYGAINSESRPLKHAPGKRGHFNYPADDFPPATRYLLYTQLAGDQETQYFRTRVYIVISPRNLPHTCAHAAVEAGYT